MPFGSRPFYIASTLVLVAACSPTTVIYSGQVGPPVQGQVTTLGGGLGSRSVATTPRGDPGQGSVAVTAGVDPGWTDVTALPPERLDAPGHLFRFSVKRGPSRQGSGFDVFPQLASDGSVIVALDHDGVLELAGQRFPSPDYCTAALARVGVDGSVRWARGLPPSSSATSVALSPSDDTVVSVFIDMSDSAVLRYSPSGHLRWTMTPTVSTDLLTINQVVIDPASDDVFMSGGFRGRIQFPGGLALQSPGRARWGFVARLDGRTGQVRWIRAVTGPRSRIGALHLVDGDLIVVGSFHRQAALGRERLRLSGDQRSAFVARLSASGQPHFARALGASLPCYILSTARSNGGVTFVWLQYSHDHALAGVADDGRLLWARPLSTAGGGRLLQSHSDSTSVWMAWSEHIFSEISEVHLTEVGEDGRDLREATLQTSAYRFFSSLHGQSTADGRFILGGSIVDDRWLNDSFYPFLAIFPPMGTTARLDIDQLPTTGRGSGDRCSPHEVAPFFSDRELRTRVIRRAGPACNIHPQGLGAVMEYAGDGRVLRAQVTGNLSDVERRCIEGLFGGARICPLGRGPVTYERDSLQP